MKPHSIKSLFRAIPLALSGLLIVSSQGPSLGAEMAKKGVTPYVTHFVFRPVQSLDVSGLGTVTLLEATGTTENLKGEKMLDKMSARCEALSVNSGPKNYIDGACVLADADGDMIFSSFDTRDLDKSQPKMDCGTHIITGGTGKYKGISGHGTYTVSVVGIGAKAKKGACSQTAPPVAQHQVVNASGPVKLP